MTTIEQTVWETIRRLDGVDLAELRTGLPFDPESTRHAVRRLHTSGCVIARFIERRVLWFATDKRPTDGRGAWQHKR